MICNYINCQDGADRTSIVSHGFVCWLLTLQGHVGQRTRNKKVVTITPSVNTDGERYRGFPVLWCESKLHQAGHMSLGRHVTGNHTSSEACSLSLTCPFQSSPPPTPSTSPGQLWLHLGPTMWRSWWPLQSYSTPGHLMRLG